jgi:hypothetical protein
MVEATLVEKHTFLEFKPQALSPDAREDCGCGRLRRSQSDSFLDYSAVQVADKDVEHAPSSLGNCETMSLSSSQFLSEDLEGISVETSTCSSDAESEGEVCTKRAQPCVAESLQQQHILAERDASAHGHSLYHVFSMPSSHQVNQLPMGGVPRELACQSANARLQAAELDAHVAELELAAARLKVAAQQIAAGTAPAPVMPMGCWLAWTGCPSQFYQASAPTQANITTRHDELTTLMLRNIPNDYTRTMLLELLDFLGLAGRYNFVYLPIDFHRMASLGYAFVNLVDHDDAEKAFRGLQGFKEWKVPSQKVCEVVWGEPLQGLSAHVERYRSSPVMHNDVPDEFKPILLQDGIRVPFPPPVKRIRPPRAKRASTHKAK